MREDPGWVLSRLHRLIEFEAARIEEVREGERNWQKLYYESRDRAEAAEAEAERLRLGIQRIHLDAMHHHELAMEDPFKAEAWVQDRTAALLKEDS
jgi:hypothetical protein